MNKHSLPTCEDLLWLIFIFRLFYLYHESKGVLKIGFMWHASGTFISPFLYKPQSKNIKTKSLQGANLRIYGITKATDTKGQGLSYGFITRDFEIETLLLRQEIFFRNSFSIRHVDISYKKHNGKPMSGQSTAKRNTVTVTKCDTVTGWGSERTGGPLTICLIWLNNKVSTAN